MGSIRNSTSSVWTSGFCTWYARLCKSQLRSKHSRTLPSHSRLLFSNQIRFVSSFDSSKFLSLLGFFSSISLSGSSYSLFLRERETNFLARRRLLIINSESAFVFMLLLLMLYEWGKVFYLPSKPAFTELFLLFDFPNKESFLHGLVYLLICCIFFFFHQILHILCWEVIIKCF